MLSEAEIVLWIVFLSLVGLVYSLVMYFTQRIGETNLRFNSHNSAIRQDQEQEYLTQQADRDDERRLNILMDAAINVYGEATLHMVIAAIVFCIVFCMWLAPQNGEVFMMFAFMCGVLVNLTSVYITLQASIAGSFKTIQQAEYGKKELIQWTWQTSTIIGMFQVSLIVLFFTVVMWIYKGLYLDVNAEISNADKYSNMFIFVLGYGLGIIFSNMMYRDAVGNAAKSASLGGEIVGRGQILDQTEANKVSNMKNLGELVANQIVNISDLTSVLVTILVASFLLISQSPTVLDTYTEAFYFPLYIIVWTILLAIALMFVAAYGDQGKDSSKMVANNFTIQIVTTAIFNLFLYVFVPRWVFPGEFVIGDTEDDEWYEAGINKGVISWCLVIGLITQLLLMTFVELFSSKVYKNVRELENVANKKFGFARVIIDANCLADNMNYVTFSVIGLSTMLGFLLGGFYGIVLVALGIVGSPIMLVALSSTCSLLVSGDNFQKHLPTMQKIFLRNAAWSAKSQLVFLQVINVGGVFLANIAAIGAIFITSNTKMINFFDPFVLLGVLVGSGVCYMLKGSSVWALQNGAALITKEPVVQLDEQSQQYPMENESQMFSSLYKSTVWFTFFQMLISTFTVLLLGVLFGTPSMIGYTIGLNFIGVHIALHSLLVSYSLSNVQAMSQDENEQRVTDNTERINQAHVAAKATNSTPGSALINFLAYNTLLVLFAASVISGTSKPMTGGVDIAPELPDVEVPEVSTEGLETAANDVAQQATDAVENPDVDVAAPEPVTLNQVGNLNQDGEGSQVEAGDQAYGSFGDMLRDNAQAIAGESTAWTDEAGDIVEGDDTMTATDNSDEAAE